MAVLQLKDVPLSSLMEQVLPFRSAKYIEDFTEKLLSEGIASPGDLLLVSREAVETKLRSHCNFNFIEMADTISLRNAVDPERARAPSESRRGRSPQRSTDSRQRSRSHDNYRGRGRGGIFSGNRNNSRPCRWGDHRADKQRDAPREKKGQPELWAAVERSDILAVQRLVTEGVDLEEKFEGWTPLMKAAEEGLVDIARLLLENKADMEATNKKGRTALSFAAAPSMNGTKPRATAVEVLRLLLTSGADAAKQDDRGMTARARAEKEKREDALAVFDVHGVNA